ncbi:Signal transduction histidine kinase (chromatophore) [Paulinella micropora]|uniref:Signal transduction histidine kinase n=1 Tax=Paulinella micropora TaxID=1928728 RepID=A0A1S6YIK9_9EUKA|nr:hypothetical protein PFK_601 [Paulinella micropora]BBL86357.1 Signal transduction histidine kinase [Paulinella micropora]
MSPLTFDYIRQQLAQDVPPGNNDEESIWYQWITALDTLEEDFLISPKSTKGIWFAAKLSAFYSATFLEQFDGWAWKSQDESCLHNSQNSVLPDAPNVRFGHSKCSILPLKETDGSDPFLVLITPGLQIALAIYGPPRERQLLIRTDPKTIDSILFQLSERINIDLPNESEHLRLLLQDMAPLQNKQDLALLFWPRLAQRLAKVRSSTLTGSSSIYSQEKQRQLADFEAHQSELVLLEALSHEVRTPLATIRTLIRSLLRRSDLANIVRQRLIQIDGECSEQIDRFGLIFHAAELQRQPESLQQLARTNLSQLLLHLKPIWQQQLERRGLRLVISITPELPEILSDPSRLETMLGGLVARYSRDLDSSHIIQLSLTSAGTRLKLQLGCKSQAGTIEPTCVQSNDKQACLNPVLTWNPTTGSLQLSQEATQRLFHSLGGQVSEGSSNSLIVFFPLAGEIC